MDRDEFIRRLVLNEIVDDYENVDQIIEPVVVRFAAKLGWTIDRPEIVSRLTELVEGGFVKAFRLSPFPPHSTQLEGMPPLPVEEYFETYFYPTVKGFDLHRSWDPWWPFNKDEEFLGWTGDHLT